MRLLPALALSAAVATAACTHPDGSPNVPGTLALGAGALIAGLAIASANDRPRYSQDRYAYRHQGHGYRSGYGPRGGYRRW